VINLINGMVCICHCSMTVDWWTEVKSVHLGAGRITKIHISAILLTWILPYSHSKYLLWVKENNYYYMLSILWHGHIVTPLDPFSHKNPDLVCVLHSLFNDTLSAEQLFGNMWCWLCSMNLKGIWQRLWSVSINNHKLGWWE